MRSSTIISVVSAAGALATPLLDRRVMVTDNFVVTVTDYVTAGAVNPAKVAETVAPQAAAPKPVVNVAAYQPHHYHHQHQAAPAPAPEPTTSSSSTSTSSTSTTSIMSSSTSVSDAAPAPEPTTYAAPSPQTTVAPSPSTPASTPASSVPTTAVPNLDTTSDVYKGIAAQHHNIHRQNNSASALTWNQTLADLAETSAKECIWQHDRTPGGGGYGQNIAAGIEPGKVASIVSNMWYNGEEPLYPLPYGVDSPDMSSFEKWGHYSQVVWSDTESVGCYTATCFPPGVNSQACKPDGSSYLQGQPCGDGIPPQAVGVPAWFTVCNYYPPGNYDNDYSKVKAPGSMGTVYMNDAGVVTGM